jgi:RHS repeat-associated protein
MSSRKRAIAPSSAMPSSYYFWTLTPFFRRARHVQRIIARSRRIGTTAFNSGFRCFLAFAGSTVLLSFGQVMTVAIPIAAGLALPLVPAAAYGQVGCESPDTDFDSDDPDPCTPPAQVDSGATGPANSMTTGPNTCNSTGGCTTWAFEAMAVSLQLHDTPVGYNPPIGPPIQFDMYYSQRDVQQPTKFTYTNFGPQWTSTYLSYVTDNTGSNGTATLYQRGGGAETYSFGTSPTSQPGPYSIAVLIKTVGSGGSTTSFTRQLADGSLEQFKQKSGNQFFMTAILDRQGNKVTIGYDAQMRIATLTDATGGVTALSYGLTSDPLKVTKVTDPFGRSATFSYGATGQLASITDVLGITSSYTYGPANFISALTTPYGTTSFRFGDSTTDATLGTTRFLLITDPLGRVSRVEFNQNAPGVLSQETTAPFGMNSDNQVLQQRDTYIWTPTQYAAATAGGGLDYTKAKVVHWLTNLDGSVSRVIESTKEPLEGRVWYDYPGQPVGAAGYVGSSSKPLHIGRVLDDGSTQLQSFQYNAFGNVTQVTDPVGRTISYTYAANGIDVLQIANTTVGPGDVLATLTYNNQHEPLSITGANGAMAKYGYNSAGQVTQFTDQAGNVSIFTYDGSGHLTTAQGPITGAQFAFTYDSSGRIATATDPAGATVTYTYDAADRPTSATYPDGTSSQLTYNLLDLASTTDRLGQKTSLVYDAQRELTQVTDPLGQVLKLGYAPDGKLSSIVDANGHATTLALDIQGRVISKIYADGTTQSIAYEANTSRVHSTTDALNQMTVYSYNADDTPAFVSYTGAVNPTSNVIFGYDAAYSRIVSMIDGVGSTTYSYYPASPTPALGANQLQSVTSPIAGAAAGTDTVTYTYDALNRVVGRNISGAADTTSFDALGRVTSVVNPLDTFTYSYADATARVSGTSSGHGPTLALTYFGPKGDELLQQMKFTKAGGAVLSQFSYTYNADDNVIGFTEGYINQTFIAMTTTGGVLGFTRSLLTSVDGAGASGWASSGGRIEWLPRWRANTVLALGMLSLVALGWLMSRPRRRWQAVWPSLIGTMALLAGSCGGGGGGGGQPNSPSPPPPPPPAPTPSAQVFSYTYDAANRLLSALVGTDLKPPSGSPQYAYVYDAASNITSITPNGPTQSLSYTSTNSIASGTYDANGSPTAVAGNTYKWDAANRLISVISGAKESDFYYDGRSRMVRVIDFQSGVVVADTAYLWCGAKRCLEHDNTRGGSPVSKQYFDEGAIVGGAPYYYVTDPHGSVRQLLDASGNVAAQYEYDPYGNQTKISGSADSDIGYAGYFHHGGSGLDFAMFRAYDSQHGRWLNRDPIGEPGGIHVYSYVGNNPLNFVDPLGLCAGGSGTASELNEPGLINLGPPGLPGLPPASVGDLVKDLLVDAGKTGKFDVSWATGKAAIAWHYTVAAVLPGVELKDFIEALPEHPVEQLAPVPPQSPVRIYRCGNGGGSQGC